MDIELNYQFQQFQLYNNNQEDNYWELRVPQHHTIYLLDKQNILTKQWLGCKYLLDSLILQLLLLHNIFLLHIAWYLFRHFHKVLKHLSYTDIQDYIHDLYYDLTQFLQDKDSNIWLDKVDRQCCQLHQLQLKVHKFLLDRVMDCKFQSDNNEQLDKHYLFDRL